MAYQASQRVLLCKKEGTPGTAETLAAADMDIMAYDPKFEFTPEFDGGLKVATPDGGKYEDIVGSLSGKVSFKIKMTPNATANAAPKYLKLFEGCGHVGAAISTTGYTITPLKAGERVTLTLWIVDISRGGTPVGIVRKIAGAMGTVKISAAGQGKPVEAEFSFTGKIVATADLANGPLASLAVFTSADTLQPYVLTDATMTAGGVVQNISSFSLDAAVDVQPEVNTADATGFDLFSVADNKNAQFSYNPLMQSVAVYDMEAKIKSMTKETYTLVINKTIDMTITVCNGQVIGAKDSVREGAIAWDTTVKCLRNGIEGTVKTAGIVVEAPYEILFGAKA